MQSVATTKNISHQRSFFQLTGDLEVDPTTHNFFLSFADQSPFTKWIRKM
jgi:hypothetical protein